MRSELERQGENPVWRALDSRLPRYLVRQCPVRVLARDAVWALDATHVARHDRGRDVQTEILRDLASGRTVGLSIGLAATARDVIELLRHTARERGGLPLVLVTDNGGPCRAGSPAGSSATASCTSGTSPAPRSTTPRASTATVS